MKIRYRGDLLNPPDDIYEPREDTYHLIEAINEDDIRAKYVLEIGCGNGLITYNLSFYAKKVFTCDINKRAVKFCKEHVKNENVFVFIGDDVKSINLNHIDVIVFNSPYLPPDEYKHPNISEQYCNETVMRIIEHLPHKKIIFYFTASSLCKNTLALCEKARSYGFKCSYKKHHYFFEDIFIFRLER